MDAKLIKPTGDRVLVLLDKPPEQTKSGLYVPETNDMSVVKSGRVLAVGPGKKVDGEWQSVNLLVGSRVMMPRHKGNRIENDERLDLILLSEGDVMATVDDSPLG